MPEDQFFLEKYEKYKDKIFNYFFYRVNFNQTIAEDLTQEAFLRAFDKIDTFDRERPFQAWIYQISKNHLKNYYRVLGRETDFESTQELSINTISKIDACLEWESTLEKIDGLKEKYREVLLLRFVDGLENGEIAQILNQKEGAIRTRISRGLKIIKEICKEV